MKCVISPLPFMLATIQSLTRARKKISISIFQECFLIGKSDFRPQFDNRKFMENLAQNGSSA
jgi:hypothetical protein